MEKLFHDVIDKAAIFAEGTQLLPGVFKLEKYPQLNRQINDLIKDLNVKIETTLYKNISNEWNQSDLNNDAVFRAAYDQKGFASPIILKRNDAALKAFILRKKGGLDLSKRIYDLTDQYKEELETGLGDGILYGKSAKTMAKDLRGYLREPDKLFRRVRKEGKLKLSKPALNYKPGQGVYRSSFKNVFRLTRTETNMSYRSADMERYKASPFVIAFEVKLSLAHPKYDICDHLAGEYPVNFVFVGWHPQCLCYNVPVLLTKAEFDVMQDDIINGIDITKKRYTTRPEPKAEQLKNWYKKNIERISNWKTKPYFIKDNPSFFLDEG